MAWIKKSLGRIFGNRLFISGERRTLIHSQKLDWRQMRKLQSKFAFITILISLASIKATKIDRELWFEKPFRTKLLRFLFQSRFGNTLRCNLDINSFFEYFFHMSLRPENQSTPNPCETSQQKKCLILFPWRLFQKMD